MRAVKSMGKQELEKVTQIFYRLPYHRGSQNFYLIQNIPLTY